MFNISFYSGINTKRTMIFKNISISTRTYFTHVEIYNCNNITLPQEK